MSDWIDGARARLKEKQAGGTYKLAEGDNCIRILPRRTTDGKLGGQPWEEFLQHNEVGPKKKFMACGKNIRGEGKCWICDALLPKLRASDKKPLRARAAAMEPVEKFIVQILYKDDRNAFQGPVVWYAPAGGRRSVSTQLMMRLIPGKRDYVSLDKGYNLNIERTGSGLATRYGALIPDDEPSPVPRELLKRMKTFEELAPKYDANAQMAAYKGEDLDEDGDADEFGYEESAKPAQEELVDDVDVAEPEWPEVDTDITELPEAEAGVVEVVGNDITDEEFESVFDIPEPPPAQRKKAAAKKK